MNFKKLRLLTCAACLLLTGTSHASTFFNPGFSFTMVSISDISQTGNSVNVQISISGLGANIAPSLGAYDLDLSFDSSHLAFSGAVFGDALLGNQLDLLNFGDTSSSAFLATADTLNLSELSFDTVEDLNNLQADSFTLATVSFDVLNVGTSQLTLFANAFADAEGNALSVITLSAPVTTVPLPSAMLLMASGLMGLGFAGKTRKVAME